MLKYSKGAKMKFILPEELGNKILNYLGSRPFGEVHQLANELMKLEVLKEATQEAKVEAPVEEKTEATTPEVL